MDPAENDAFEVILTENSDFNKLTPTTTYISAFNV
jgi:hypothetical protein